MVDEPDLAIILVAANRCLTTASSRPCARRARATCAPAFGFVIRAVDAEEPTVTRLAELLGVSRQAASKLADEMVQRGYLLRAPDPDDRRRTRLRLSAKGRRVRERAAAESAAIEAELRAAVGDRAVDGLRARAAGLRRARGRARGGPGAAVARAVVSRQPAAGGATAAPRPAARRWRAGRRRPTSRSSTGRRAGSRSQR